MSLEAASLSSVVPVNSMLGSPAQAAGNQRRQAGSRRTQAERQRQGPEAGARGRGQRQGPEAGARGRGQRQGPEAGARGRSQRQEPEAGARGRGQRQGPEAGARGRGQRQGPGKPEADAGVARHKLKQQSYAHTRPPAKDRTESDCKDDGGYVYIGIDVARAPGRTTLKPQR